MHVAQSSDSLHRLCVEQINVDAPAQIAARIIMIDSIRPEPAQISSRTLSPLESQSSPMRCTREMNSTLSLTPASYASAACCRA